MRTIDLEKGMNSGDSRRLSVVFALPITVGIELNRSGEMRGQTRVL